MSAYLLKKLRKPGFTTTFLAGMLSNIVVFAEPVSRAANNYLSETPSATYRHINFGTPAINNPQPSVSPANSHHSELEPLFAFSTEKKPSTATKKKNKPTAKTLPSNTRTYTPTEEYQIFYAPESQGAIGISEEKRFDNARDNFFTVVFPDSIALDTYTPVLSYTLHGLSGAQSTTKSINGSVAYGGEQPVKDDSWKEVEEYLPASLLNPGKNEIFFTRRTDTKYRYHVKDVHIKLYPATYEAPEAIKWAEAAVFTPDNTLESKTFTFPTADEGPGSFYALELTPVSTKEAEDNPEVKVQALPFKDIKPLEQDLVNVTLGPYKSFRVSFAKSTKDTLKLHLKYDPEEIPEGYSSKDIRTFIYDKNSRRWKSLPVEAVDLEANTVTSLISDPGGETDYINGIIKVPEHPETAGFAPTTLTDIEFANPAAGIVSIAPPSPNNTGSVTTSFPIKLPPGRNGLQPSLEVVYNSEGGNG